MPTSTRNDLSPLATFTRAPDDAPVTIAEVGGEAAHTVPRALFGNFFEHMAVATVGGALAELLVNPIFHRKHYLDRDQRDALLHNGGVIDEWERTGDAGTVQQNWIPEIGASGFGIALFDDDTDRGVPLPWAAVGVGAVLPSVGRVGHAVRLTGTGETADSDLSTGPTGIRQVIHLPQRRPSRVHVTGTARVVGGGAGTVEVSLRRRTSGTPLAITEFRVAGEPWTRFGGDLEFDPAVIAERESLDFAVRWLASPGDDLQLDRVSAVPEGALGVFDPEVVALAREVTPELRWPGGNFVSYYRWQHGVGPVEDRPTVQNQAWGGLELNTIGTDEYLYLCDLLGAEPHITVNAGTGTPDEAAAWVEYCNGPADSPMGARRAANGHPDPYNVVIWEIGNELWGEFQGGNVGGDVNARRYAEFAAAMRAASPVPLRLLATGNWFDLVDRTPAQLDYASVDGAWQSGLLSHAADDIDAISMHWLPIAHGFVPDDPEADELANRALLAQPLTAERHQLPRLFQQLDMARTTGRPIEIALTEWCPLGSLDNVHADRLLPNNFGSIVWAAAFFHTVMRCGDRLTSASPNGFLHGGSIKKAAGRVYRDPSVELQEAYLREFAGARLIPVNVTGPGFDSHVRTDLSAPEADIPFIDVVAAEHDDRVVMAALNRDGAAARRVTITLPTPAPTVLQTWQFQGSSLAGRRTFADPTAFPTTNGTLDVVDGTAVLELEPHAVVLYQWARL